ncbi:unnamed protein product [Didymodactylos carnosus]|uniref:NB-ARC domain-containing protein n=1 Tax=Didymodactylos carnosus TaxID=1234261 RepID=A0A815WY60_9BILA|nr:unnamed protein product [Didymodactylos carnosus]CAF4411471.1 unnamed protein product [Didymodactylos carnosus]
MVPKLDKISSDISQLRNEVAILTQKNIMNLREDKALILSSNIPDESIKNLIQKEALFKEIEEIFSKSNKYVIISGYAGSGKTTLASNYGLKERNENNKIVRWFSNAKSSALVWEDYKNMATNELSIGNDINKRQTINLVNLTLTVSKRKILFIFDNVKNADDIKELIINLPNNVQTIITTKNTTLKHNFEFGNESNLEMKPFNKTECIEYIIKWNKKRRFNQFEAEKIIDLIKRNKKEISIFLLAKVMELLQTKSWTIERFEKKMEYEMTEAKAAEYILNPFRTGLIFI